MSAFWYAVERSMEAWWMVGRVQAGVTWLARKGQEKGSRHPFHVYTYL